MATLPLCIITTESDVYYPTHRTNNCWRSVDDHYQDGTRSLSLSFVCIKVFNTLLCITTTILLVNYWTNKTKNRWRSVDTHFQDGDGSVLVSVLPIKGGNTSIMCIHYQIMFLLPDKLQNLKSLTFCWRSFCHRRNRNMEPFTLAYCIYNGLVAAILCCSCTFSFLTTLFFNDA